MFASLARFSRTTYRGSRGSGPGRSGKTDARSSPDSRNTAVVAAHAGQTFKRAQRGLYDGKIIQFGNNVPKSRTKTRRTWLPNVQTQRVFSELLDRDVRMKVTTSALRSIQKAGGLDRYLAHTKDSILGRFGCELRDRIAERLALGELPGLANLMSRQRAEQVEAEAQAAIAKPASAIRHKHSAKKGASAEAATKTAASTSITPTPTPEASQPEAAR
ncbi:hypothetical protein V8E36_000668 [Tilletia maclaganii]